jgi:hypothetical protein
MLSSPAADPSMRFKPRSTGHAMAASRQRAAPVVVPEGPSAGGGVRFTAVDPGVPLSPGLLATCPVFHGPPMRIARARTIATMMIANVLPLIEPFLF